MAAGNGGGKPAKTAGSTGGTPTSSSTSKTPDFIPGICPSPGCKTKPEKFGFCPTHFDYFKFGLITKGGQPVPDFDKKFDAYMRLQKKLKAA